MNYIHIAQRVFNTPLMIHPGKLNEILHTLAPRLGFPVPEIEAGIDTAFELRSWLYDDARGDGIEVIPISGTLVNRYATGPSGTVSYDRIRDRVGKAAGDENIRGILLQLNSFGGEVDGVFDTADVIREAAKAKPVWASVDDNAFSAAYLLASQAHRVYTTRTGGVGSVGVIAVHYDFSRWLNKEGITPTLMYFGERKADFSPELPLSPEAREKLQGDVNRFGLQFVEYVAQGRRLTESAVRATEADWYTGEAGIARGFADRLGTFDHALREFKSELDGRTSVSFSGPQRGSPAPSEFPAKEESMSKTSTAESPAVEPKVDKQSTEPKVAPSPPIQTQREVGLRRHTPNASASAPFSAVRKLKAGKRWRRPLRLKRTRSRRLRANCSPPRSPSPEIHLRRRWPG